MQTVTHKMWPVSYIDDQGKQQNQLYTFDPIKVDPSYWVGEPINIVAHHTDGMTDTHKAEKIESLRAQIAKLEARDVEA